MHNTIEPSPMNFIPAQWAHPMKPKEIACMTPVVSELIGAWDVSTNGLRLVRDVTILLVRTIDGFFLRGGVASLLFQGGDKIAQFATNFFFNRAANEAMDNFEFSTEENGQWTSNTNSKIVTDSDTELSDTELSDTELSDSSEQHHIDFKEELSKTSVDQCRFANNWGRDRAKIRQLMVTSLIIVVQDCYNIGLGLFRLTPFTELYYKAKYDFHSHNHSNPALDYLLSTQNPQTRQTESKSNGE